MRHRLMTVSSVAILGLGMGSAQASDAARIAALERQVQELSTMLEQTATTLKELKEEKADKKSTPVFTKGEPAFGLTSPDGAFSFNVRGRLLADYGFSSDQDDQFTGDGAEIRSGRLGIEGVAFHDVDYKFEVDFSDGDADITDATISFNPELAEGVKTGITLGQFKTQNSAEEQTSSRFITFLERAQFTDSFGFDRQLGLGVGAGFGPVRVDGGVFFENFDVDTDSPGEVDEGLTLALRGTYADKIGESSNIQFGGSVRYREAGDESEAFGYDNDLPVQLGRDNLVETPDIGRNDLFLGGEFGFGTGSFHTALEGGVLFVNNEDLVDEPTFYGGAIEAGYWLTGEKHTLGGGYYANRPKVLAPLFQGGFGAVQLAGRVDYIDLSDGANANGTPIQGGEALSLVAGLNWWPNSYVRLSANYAFTLLDDAETAQVLAGSSDDGENNIHTFGLRAQVDF